MTKMYSFWGIFFVFFFIFLFNRFYSDKSGEYERNYNCDQSESNHKYVETFLAKDIRKRRNIIVNSLNDVDMTTFPVFTHSALPSRFSLSFQITNVFGVKSSVLFTFAGFRFNYAHLFFHWSQR